MSLQHQLPLDGVKVEALPFRIGRRPEPGESGPDVSIQLEVEDTEPYQMSRDHCAIVRLNDGVGLKDSGSHWGTLVNGVRIGGAGNRERVSRLRKGYNTVIAGSGKSRFHFAIVVDERSEGEAALPGTGGQGVLWDDAQR